MQIFVIEFGRRIVQKQHRAQTEFVLKEPELRDDHGDGRELLLPARKRFSGYPMIASKCHVSPMRSGRRRPSRSISIRVCAQRILERCAG